MHTTADHRTSNASRRLLLASFLCVLSFSAVNPSRAGDLTPPTGPIAPTQRTPINGNTTPGDADSLFKITAPGSYYLTGNITGVAAKHGIEIAVGGVTIDLMGFELLGVPGSFDGISNIGLDNDNVSVRNGTVRGWGGDGVDLTATGGISGSVTDIISTDNALIGIIGTFNSQIERCVTAENGSHGIDVRTGSVIVSCTAYRNGADGISADSASTLAHCFAYDNIGDGIDASEATITGCIASNNGSNGIFVNTASTIIGCSVQFNNAAGIRTNDGCVVKDCSARFNQTDGIYVTDDCIVTGNTCTNNGSAGDGAGIHATGIGNRIEGNICNNADRGIDVDSSGNFIARNTCRANTSNWEVAAGNYCLVVLGTSAAAISGDSGGVSPGSTNPNANFTY